MPYLFNIYAIKLNSNINRKLTFVGFHKIYHNPYVSQNVEYIFLLTWITPKTLLKKISSLFFSDYKRRINRMTFKLTTV